jgi:hypothetical protein
VDVERFFHYYTYGRSRNRWEDYKKDWNLPVKLLRKLLNNKLEQELQTRQNWPMYAFVGEDIELEKKILGVIGLRNQRDSAFTCRIIPMFH